MKIKCNDYKTDVISLNYIISKKKKKALNLGGLSYYFSHFLCGYGVIMLIVR